MMISIFKSLHGDLESLIDESKSPNLFKWAQDFCADDAVDDAVKDVLPETNKLMEFAQVHVANFKVSKKN
ncbi:hypothetical protein BUALT_Bualt17G0057500 [Buddleja alternifolia]|uniref:Uncharacterized protein n=1 Tax=Buddleja alternifolia TaxID=168488 RepID=A0AAV6WE57_9LAMI|nr:hypothetical protein BUALT_Bualt17G0057500 [Buddleja alternifolia]